MTARLENCEELHPSHGNWKEFLATCELRGESKGWKWHGRTNCNYFVDPNGNVYVGPYGYNGANAWARIVEDPEAWLKDLNAFKAEVSEILSRLKCGGDR